MFESINKLIDVGTVIVERKARTAARLNTQVRKQRLRTVMPGADCYIIHIENTRHVMRVNTAHVKADDTMMKRWIFGPDNTYKVQFR